MKIYLVGGAVRDKLLGLPVKERDYVVVGATVSDMLALGFKQVGKEFPVFLHPQTNEEYALARMERKTEPGYKGFAFDTSPNVTLEEDLLRRDLTINAMAIDLDHIDQANPPIVDPYHGKADLEKKLLRHVSPAFAEDPVRILRVGRFLARYASLGFQVAPETTHLMKNMTQAGEVDALVAERVWKELERALGEENPEKFFDVLHTCNALPILFPALEIHGAGIKALAFAVKLTIPQQSWEHKKLEHEENIIQKKIVAVNNHHPTAIRFAALLHSFPENDYPADTKSAIAQLCNRYRVPNYFSDLATLTALHYSSAVRATTLSANELLTLFSALDIFRREDRFQDFLRACEAIAQSTQQHFNSDWLYQGARIAKSVEVQPLIGAGFTGQTLAKKLREARLEKIANWQLRER